MPSINAAQTKTNATHMVSVWQCSKTTLNALAPSSPIKLAWRQRADSEESPTRRLASAYELDFRSITAEHAEAKPVTSCGHILAMCFLKWTKLITQPFDSPQ